ncbi:MAG: hypothetical protein F7C32_00240 [Desulfurococcales archaeon]|nr:hypothetical protein [Desulfurococcales archaeon]
MKRVKIDPDMEEFLLRILEYQFDIMFAKRALKEVSEVEIARSGSPRYFYSGKELFLVLRPSDGLFSLTPSSARLLHEITSNEYRVVADSGVVLKGSLLAPGVLDCWDGIRGGDEVLIVSPDDQLMGVGRAKMSCSAMKSVPRGEVVRVRHALG